MRRERLPLSTCAKMFVRKGWTGRALGVNTPLTWNANKVESLTPRRAIMTSRRNELCYGLMGATCAHLCVDMQRLFAQKTEWNTPWMDRVLPKVCQLIAAHPARTIFTRFIPAEHPGEGSGTWRRYFERWSQMTIEKLGRETTGLVPELLTFVPPATVVDKRVYSPWYETDLHARLQDRFVDALVVSGAETDVCVLSSVLGAIDRGYRVIIATDALCSSSDETHDALLTVSRSKQSRPMSSLRIGRDLFPVQPPWPNMPQAKKGSGRRNGQCIGDGFAFDDLAHDDIDVGT
jgi:nicotinamidase-related amidase